VTAVLRARAVLRRLADLVLVLAVLAFAALAVGPHVLGYRTATMLTPSMAPGIEPGDVVGDTALPVAEIEPGMVLTFHIPVGDFHCGIRAFRRDRILALGLHSSGMEFASEMVVRAALGGCRITEVPTSLHPDGRRRPPLRPSASRAAVAHSGATPPLRSLVPAPRPPQEPAPREAP